MRAPFVKETELSSIGVPTINHGFAWRWSSARVSANVQREGVSTCPWVSEVTSGSRCTSPPGPSQHVLLLLLSSAVMLGWQQRIHRVTSVFAHLLPSVAHICHRWHWRVGIWGAGNLKPWCFSGASALCRKSPWFFPWWTTFSVSQIVLGSPWSHQSL